MDAARTGSDVKTTPKLCACTCEISTQLLVLLVTPHPVSLQSYCPRELMFSVPQYFPILNPQSNHWSSSKFPPPFIAIFDPVSLYVYSFACFHIFLCLRQINFLSPPLSVDPLKVANSPLSQSFCNLLPSRIPRSFLSSFSKWALF